MQEIHVSNIGNYDICAAYVVPSQSPFLIALSTFKDSTETDFDRLCTEYEIKAKQQYPNIGTTTYSVNGLRCWQGRWISNNIVAFRLIVSPENSRIPVQIDFIYPADSSADWSRVIESVIGSITIHKVR